MGGGWGLELTRVCICCCLTASQDQHSQLEVVQTRLAATERALQDANAKASDLNSRLALAETEDSAVLLPVGDRAVLVALRAAVRGVMAASVGHLQEVQADRVVAEDSADPAAKAALADRTLKWRRRTRS